MEKIYEEQSYSKKSSKMNFSVVLSFIVAAFAIFSLIVVGFNRVSYAEEPTEEVTLKFKYYDPIASRNPNPAQIKNDRTTGGAAYTAYFVPMLYVTKTAGGAITNEPVFCVQAGKTAGEDQEYEKDDEEFDYDPGIAYILSQSGVLNSSKQIVPRETEYPTAPAGAPAPGGYGATGRLSNDDYEALESYATQVAIWVYQFYKYDSTDSRHGDMSKDEFKAYTGGLAYDSTDTDESQPANLYSSKDGFTQIIYSGDLYDDCIKDVVTAALSATSTQAIEIELSSDDVKLTEDEKEYQAGEFSVSAEPNDLNIYYVSLSGDLGADAYVVDANGNKVEYTDPLDASAVFYVRVPASKVTEEKKNVKVKVSGEFNTTKRGSYYFASNRSAGHQAVVSFADINPKADDEKNVYFMVNPDTGMSTAQTIYFVGLIVLLCGVGIIYANAKPVEDK